MEFDMYEQELLISKFPDLSSHIVAGDMKILVDKQEGKPQRIIVRFPNTTILPFPWNMAEHFAVELFHGVPSSDIVIRNYGLVGVEMTTK